MNGHTLISPENNWAIWAILISVAAFGLWAEKTKIGSRLSGAVISIFAGFLLSNLRILPVDAPAYGMTWSFLVPLAIPLLLFKANLLKIFKESGPTLAAFIIGGIGSVLGTFVAFYMVPLGEEAWKLAGIFCATYIGGSMNYMAVADSLQLHSGDLLTAGIAADNLVMTLYFLILFSLPSLPFIQKLFPLHKNEIEEKKHTPASMESESPISVFDMAASLAIGATICAIGYALEGVINISGSAILIITLLAVLLATFLPGKLEKIKGSSELGTLFMQIFFAVIGASANIGVVLKVGPRLFLFAAVILTVHLIFLLFFTRLFKFDIREVVIASNANMGGPTTSAAMAIARRWEGLIIPAILSGTFGYAIASFIGTAIGHLLH